MKGYGAAPTTLPTHQRCAHDDSAGRVNGVIQPGGGSGTVAHNGAGQPTMAGVPSGGSQVWGYDTAGRPVSATWLQAGSPVFAQVATLDPAG